VVATLQRKLNAAGEVEDLALVQWHQASDLLHGQAQAVQMEETEAQNAVFDD